MWIVVTLAKSKDAASKIKEILSAEGLLVKSKPLYKNVNDETNYYEVLVLESEAQEAREILTDNGL
jgi:hypothetical protein